MKTFDLLFLLDELKSTLVLEEKMLEKIKQYNPQTKDPMLISEINVQLGIQKINNLLADYVPKAQL